MTAARISLFTLMGYRWSVFELKNPYAIKPTVDDALNQMQHYVHDISQLFDYNALVVVSDGINTQHGMWSADVEWYGPWKSINGFDIEPNTIGQHEGSR